MAASFSDAAIDGGLDYILNNTTNVSICTSDPAGNYASIAGAEVAEYTGLTSGSFTKANGDVSGRKVTLNQLTGNNGSGTGAANFVVGHDGTSEWIWTIDGDGDTVNSGSPVTINAVDVLEIRDPA